MLSAHFEGYLEDVMAEALAAVNPSLAASVVTVGFHNPWPDRIDDLFAFVGMKVARIRDRSRASWAGGLLWVAA